MTIAVVGIVGRGKRRDDQRDGLLLVGLQHDQRPQIVVPVQHEDDDDGRRIGRAHDRHVDEEEDLPFLEAIDPRRVTQFAGEGLRALAEVEDDEDRRDRRQDDGGKCVDQVEPARSSRRAAP